MVRSNAAKSWVLVAVQVICLALIAVSGPLFPRNPVLLAIELLGIALGIWAVLVMGIGKFHIVPDPLESSQLVTLGPYRWIRHPMYLALLVATFPLIVNPPSTLRGVVWLILLVDLLLKLNYEERLLEALLEGYSDYKKQTYKLIPLIY